MGISTTVLVGTDDGLHQLHPTRALDLAGQAVRSLAYDGHGWWALAAGSTLWHQEAGGEWKRTAALDGPSAECLAALSEGLLIGTSRARLYRWQDGQMRAIDSFRRAPTREDWFTPWGGPAAVRSISSGPEGTIYVNVHVGGVLRSDDGGETWEQTIDIRADVHQVHYDHASGTLLTASGRGLGISRDRGKSWRFEREGLHGTYLRAVDISGGTLLVSASTGPRSSRAAIYHKELATDQPFSRCRTGLPEWFPSNIDTRCLAASGSEAIFGTDEGQVYASEDGGESWQMIEGGLPAVRCIALGA